MKGLKKTSQEWYELVPKEYKLIIYDADGWDRSNYQYSFHEELITFNEFSYRLMGSTIMCGVKFNQNDWAKEVLEKLK